MYASAEELLHDVDVVSIASPSRLHLAHALLAIELGVDVLIEKPLTLTVPEGRELKRVVDAIGSSRIVQVGHIEHFDPAVRELRKLLEGHQVLAIAIERIGPSDWRAADSDVIHDLMLHDVHVLMTMVSAPLRWPNAVGRSAGGPGLADYAVANLVFDDGVVATLTARRETQDKVRRMSVSTATAHVAVDYLYRTLNVCRMASLTPDAADSRTYRQESTTERIWVPMEEPLVAQIHSFLASVRERREPEVTLDTAFAASSWSRRSSSGSPSPRVHASLGP